MSEYREELVRRIPNRGLIALPFVAAALSLVLAATPHFAGIGLMLMFLSIISGLRLARTNPRARLEPADVAVDANELRVGDEHIPRSELRQALVVPQRTAAPIVRLSRRHRLPLELVVSNAEEGRRLLRALGFDASQVTARFWTASRLLAAPRNWRIASSAALALAVFVAMRAVPFAAYLLPALVVALALLVTLPTPVEVGADGVMIRSLWGRRFVPMGDIDRVEPYAEHHRGRSLHGAVIRLRDGTAVTLPIGSRRGDDVSTATLIERMREAIDTFRQGNVEGAAALLDRGGRSMHDWINYLRGVGIGANATLRSAPVAPERLWRVVESASAKPVDRVAAALALSARPQGEGGGDRKRLRVAAEATVEPKLRVALQAVASDEVDEATLERALEEMGAHK